MLTASADAAAKFDPDRAGEYEIQSRIGLAGYDACHELSACMLAAALGAGTTASILVVGAGGTAQEIITAGKLESNWRFTAVDPSRPMSDLAIQRLTAAGLAGRTDVRLGCVDDLPGDEQFDAATLIGVLQLRNSLQDILFRFFTREMVALNQKPRLFWQGTTMPIRASL